MLRPVRHVQFQVALTTPSSSNESDMMKAPHRMSSDKKHKGFLPERLLVAALLEQRDCSATFRCDWGTMQAGGFLCLASSGSSCRFLIERHEKARATHRCRRNASLCRQCVITCSGLIVLGDAIDLTADVRLFTQPS